MGLFKFFKKQLATVIQWTPQQSDLLIWKYPTATDELKNASKLIVGPGQGCILVYEGQVREVLDTEGIYTVDTDNIPFITTLIKIMQLFESEHKVGLYFYRKAEVLDQGWGTSSPIKYMDASYNIPVELSAFGNFSYKLSEPRSFFEQYVGTQDAYSTAAFREVMQSRIPQLLKSHLAEAAIPYTRIDAELNNIAAAMQAELSSEFQKLAIAITDFRIEGNSFDADTKDRIGEIADISAGAKAAAEGGLSYAELEKLRALRDAARNEGGLAGAGAAIGAGMSMGKLFSDTVEQQTKAPEEKDNAKEEEIERKELDEEKKDPIAQLKKLKLLLDEDIITQGEFEAKKKEYLDKL